MRFLRRGAQLRAVDALERCADEAFWVGRPIERPGVRPLAFEGGADLGAKIAIAFSPTTSRGRPGM